MKFYYVKNIFDLHTFTMNRRPFKNFFKFLRKCILFLYFLNKRSITTSLLIIHVKCTVAHYANLNSKSINKPYLRAVEKAFSFFFDFFFMFILTRL